MAASAEQQEQCALPGSSLPALLGAGVAAAGATTVATDAADAEANPLFHKLLATVGGGAMTYEHTHTQRAKTLPSLSLETLWRLARDSCSHSSFFFKAPRKGRAACDRVP
jgi:hypothetical protein